MSRRSVQKESGTAAVSLATSESDAALIMALCAWTGSPARPAAIASEQSRAAAPDALERYAAWLDPARLNRLRACWGHDASDGDAAGRQSCARSTSNNAPPFCPRGPPPRALKLVGPRTQRRVARRPACCRSQRRRTDARPLQNELLLDSEDLATERAPAPEVVRWVMALWTERLVGGEPKRPDDSLALIVVDRAVAPRRLSPVPPGRPRQAAALAEGEPLASGHSQKAHERAHWFVSRLTEAGPGAGSDVDAQFVDLARKDVQSSMASGVPRRHLEALIGVTTIARLLAGVEPVRLRWALQHWPYPLAKLIRSVIAQTPRMPPWLSRRESSILKTAWERLNLEGKLGSEPPLDEARGRPCAPD